MILSKSYGDCKDKANLMRAMLKVVGIDAYLVAVYLGDPAYVREEWPSPQQFNHMALAVQLPGPETAESVLLHPVLGRLLIFDPTDTDTIFGYLPSEEQGSLALLVDGDAGGLLRMPISSPKANRQEREIDLEISMDADLTGRLAAHSWGNAATAERRLLRHASPAEYRQAMERRIGQDVPRVVVASITPDDAEPEFRHTLTFTAAGYGQAMGDRILAVRLALPRIRSPLAAAAATRKYPIMLNSHAYSDVVRMRIPSGLKIDETPKDIQLEAPCGTYRATYEVKGGEVVFTRSLEERAAVLPPEQFPAVNDFYRKIAATEQAPVILARE